jgi:hypothetical protein
MRNVWSKILLHTGIGVGAASAAVANTRVRNSENREFLFSFRKYLMFVELLMEQFSINSKERFEVADIDYIAGTTAMNHILAPNSVERRHFRPHLTSSNCPPSWSLYNACKFAKQFNYTLYSTKIGIA